METAKLSTKGQLVIPTRCRKALHLQPGDTIGFQVEGDRLVLQRERVGEATMIIRDGRKLLVAPADAPPMTTESVKAILSDFP